MVVTKAEASPAKKSRNPGPSWGYQFMRGCDRLLPELVFRPLRAAGTAVAVACMPAQRRHSREYLRTVLPDRPRLRDVFRHFLAFEESLMLRLRVINGLQHRCDPAPDAVGFPEWLGRDFPVLLGTFHVGVSDLLGFVLGHRERRLVHIVRLRVGNSHDTERLFAKFGDWVRLVWINEPAELVFALKEAAAQPGAIAMQCDRAEFSSRLEPFEFLGATRLFPFTIYELARLFDRPVILSVGVPATPDRSVLHDSPIFRPNPAEPREATRARAREHFQAFLRRLEKLLRQHPYLWFNFTPLNPAVPSPSS